MGNRPSPLPTASNAARNSYFVPSSSVYQPNHDILAALRRHLPPDHLPSPPDKLPIIYHEDYNISFYGIEKLHPFDSQKYRHVVDMLCKDGLIKTKDDLITAPPPPSLDALSDVHSMQYLRALESSSLKVAQVTELAPLAFVPAFLTRSKVLSPMKRMVSGTLLAGVVALERGWSLHLGGGQHHAHYSDGGGWCCYDDITFLIRALARASEGLLKNVMIVDLDVHQGNGHERSKLHFMRSAGTDDVNMPNTVIQGFC